MNKMKQIGLLACVWLGLWIWGGSSPSFAQGTPRRFHYPHIKIWDFGRAQEHISDPAQQAIVYDFLAAHVDVVECDIATKSLELKQRNPDIRTFTYRLDISQCIHQGCSADLALAPDPPGFTEEMYLHFAETTTYRLNVYYTNPPQTVTITVPGCSDPAHPTKESRVRTYMWLDFRYVYNQKSQAFREAMAQKLIADSAAIHSDGLFFDEHGPGISGAVAWSPSNVISGGRLLEYPGRRLNEIDVESNADLVASLEYYKQELNAHNKFIVINGAAWSAFDPLVMDQEKAAGGTVTEFLIRPTVGDGSENYEHLLAGLEEVLAAGGKIDLLGSIGYHNEIAGLNNWIPGNYSTQVGRWQMWRLANYYLVREMEGAPGEAYFSPDFDTSHFGDPAHCLDFIDDWLPAYEVNVGYPDGSRNPTYLEGTGNWYTYPWNGQPVHWQVFSRSFGNGNVLVLLRSRDAWDCQAFGDESGVQVPLDRPRYLLRENGAFSAQPLTSVTLRQSEAVILFADPHPYDTRTIPLQAGWNWISFNVLPENCSFNAVFGGILDRVEQVRTQSRSVLRLNGNWIGDLADMGDIEQGAMYKVRVDQACTLTVSGTPMVATTTISLTAGWNWVAFLPSASLPVVQALASISGHGQQAKSQTQSAIYQNGGWLGDLQQLEPGKGYTIRMDAPGTLTYPAGQ